jgi:high affinity Mn2+ porin
MTRRILTIIFCYLIILQVLSYSLSLAQNTSSPNDSTESWSYHFQYTGIEQTHNSFYAKYSGQNSLDNNAESRFSVTTTLFMGIKLWDEGEFYLNTEMGGGTGFSLARGIAGFPNGEVYRVDDVTPNIYFARGFLRQHFPLSTQEREKVEPDQNQIGEWLPKSRLTLTVGKFSLTDIFDDNAYSHDPRKQFMNWALWAPGAWDYAADTRGYNWGFAAELHLSTILLNFAVVMVPTSANGPVFDSKIDKAHSFNLEVVKPLNINNQTGKVHFIGFLNQAQMGNYRMSIDDALSNGTMPDITTTRSYRSKYGFALCLEQSLNEDTGLFSRFSWNDGHTETWAFTEIDRSFQLGLNVRGNTWHRHDDYAGIAIALNALSEDHKDYLSQGGYGFIIGDGKLNYGLEQVAEVFYCLKLTTTFWITVDYQAIVNPGYNRDRGPLVNVIGWRGHVEL